MTKSEAMHHTKLDAHKVDAVYRAQMVITNRGLNSSPCTLAEFGPSVWTSPASRGWEKLAVALMSGLTLGLQQH